MVNDRGQSDQSRPTCGGCSKRESEDESDLRGLNTKLHLALDQNGRPIRAIIRTCTTADCCQAESLRPGIQIQYLLADWGYDNQAILQTANQAEIRPVIGRQRKIENVREMTTKIDTKCGPESKMLSGILNDEVESPQVRVKIQTLFSRYSDRVYILWATRDYTM